MPRRMRNSALHFTLPLPAAVAASFRCFSKLAHRYGVEMLYVLASRCLPLLTPPCFHQDGFNVLQLAMESGQAKLLEALLSADKSRSHKRVLLTGHPESSCEFGSCSDCWGDDYSGEVDAVLHSHWQKYKDAKFEREAAAMRAELDALRSGMR
eukprot:PLAT16105.3.p1 GENE.PLAT16105.3~~PLAT16105.3.p1  ORF type:complete len:153 (-),score=33.17 PLAT16105.3:106-564(-)